jgi:hypothetical protein
MIAQAGSKTRLMKFLPLAQHRVEQKFFDAWIGPLDVGQLREGPIAHFIFGCVEHVVERFVGPNDPPPIIHDQHRMRDGEHYGLGIFPGALQRGGDGFLFGDVDDGRFEKFAFVCFDSRGNQFDGENVFSAVDLKFRGDIFCGGAAATA